MRQLEQLFKIGLEIAGVIDPGEQVAAETDGRTYTWGLHRNQGIYYVVRMSRIRGAQPRIRRVSLFGVVYVAGPMRGYEKNNFPAFDIARDFLVRVGFYVFNPADMDRAIGITEDTKVLPPDFMRSAMDRDLNAITKCTHVYLLEGWENSVGVRAEGILADVLDLIFITGHPVIIVPAVAVSGVIGGRLVGRFNEWAKTQPDVQAVNPLMPTVS